MWFAFDRERSPLHQLSLMPNHSHFIATPEEENSLSKAMKSCLQRYAQARNRRKCASGRLFEERFWCKPLLTAADVEAVTLYNDANAMEAAMVSHPADHVWSTCAIHYGQPDRSRVPLEMWTPSAWYLSLGADAPAVYADRMRQFLEGRLHDWRFERLREIEKLASLDCRHPHGPPERQLRALSCKSPFTRRNAAVARSWDGEPVPYFSSRSMIAASLFSSPLS